MLTSVEEWKKNLQFMLHKNTNHIATSSVKKNLKEHTHAESEVEESVEPVRPIRLCSNFGIAERKTTGELPTKLEKDLCSGRVQWILSRILHEPKTIVKLDCTKQTHFWYLSVIIITV